MLVTTLYFTGILLCKLTFFIESTACNHNIFEFSKIWSENPRVGSLCAFDRLGR